jgi:S1-C subfamily serine protease
VIARQEFAGYWEYVLDEALFTAPAHPHWGGTAVIDASGALIGLGSLQLQTGDGRGARNVNMAIPIDLLPPILDDMLTLGRPSGPARPWLGLYATEMDDQIVVMGLAGKGPAAQADVQVGDVVKAVAGEPIGDLAGLFRSVWALGEAGVAVPLTLERDGRKLQKRIASSDRARFLVAPQLH